MDSGVLLRGNALVTELMLGSNDLTAVGATRILEHLTRSISTLDISNVVQAEDALKAEKRGGAPIRRRRPATVAR